MEKSDRGFTIVELLVVIVVIGILAAITIVSYTGISQKANIATLTSDLDSASRQLKLYQVTSTTGYPTSLDANYCPIPTDSARCLKPSPGTSYTSYVVNNGAVPQNFCITARKESVNYKITNDSAPVLGDCQNYGLVLSLDAGNAASYPGSGTVWTDLSGNGNNGTLINGVGYTNPNINPNDASLAFDGVNDYVDAGSGTTLQLTRTGSVCIWLKSATAFSGSTGVMRNVIGGGPSSFYFSSSTSHLYYYLPNGTYARPNLGSWDTNWHNVCVTSDGTILIMYIDSIAQSTTGNVNGGNFFANTGPLTINRSVSPFAGQISNVSVYNRGLISGEITQNFNNLKGRYGL